jgi:hypothetical protein
MQLLEELDAAKGLADTLLVFNSRCNNPNVDSGTDCKHCAFENSTYCAKLFLDAWVLEMRVKRAMLVKGEL